MPRSIHSPRLPAQTEGTPLQRVLGTTKLTTVPSLRALEQTGDPEIDGPLTLPDPVIWSSRSNELAESFS